MRQVWVANRVAGTERVSFKGHHGRYLGCDKFGVLSATREAVGPEEGFVVVPAPGVPGGFGAQNAREGFITVQEDEVEGGDGDADGDEKGAVRRIKMPEIRGDAETIGFSATIRIRMQARFKPRMKANKETKAREKVSRKELEEAVGRRLEDDEVRRLKRARREGWWHEAVLDHRVKGKHDKFAS